MKEIDFNGTKLWYKRIISGGMLDTVVTVFYRNLGSTKTSRKYWLFGPKITTPCLDEYFTIYRDVENYYYEKNTIRYWIEEAIKIENRKDEIKNGQLI